MNNKIIINGTETKPNKAALKTGLSKLNNQKPNKKFLFVFRARLGFYTFANKASKSEKPSKFNKWMKEKLGEEPKILDTTLIDPTKSRMQGYLFNKGYFHNEISTAWTSKKKKATVVYNINLNDSYSIRNFDLTTNDSSLNYLIEATEANSIIKTGDKYDSDNVKKERDRVTGILREEGYFTFNRNYLYFQIDTSIGNQKVDVNLLVNNLEDSTFHKKYTVGIVQFNIDKKGTKKDDLSKIDTTILRKVKILLTSNDIKPDLLARYIYFTPDSLFHESNYSKTVTRLSSLGIFKYVDIEYEPFQISQDEGVVDISIKASLSKKQGATIALEGNTDNQSSFGTALNISYLNRNIFKRADRLQFNLSSGLEFNFNNPVDDEGNKLSTLSIVDLNGDLKLYFPKILFPAKKIKNNLTPYKFKPNTFIGLSYSFQKRVNLYSINTSNVSFGYDFKTAPESRHIISFPLSLVRPNESSYSAIFLETLEKSPFLRQSFRQQFIASLIDYTYSYTSQSFGKLKNFLYFRGNLNVAGNLLYAANKAFTPKKEEPYKILKVPYSQYARIEGDFRYYFTLKKGQALVTRAFAGFGIPFGNADVLPYVKQFFGGGNQSLRAWGYKAIGPGGFDTRNADFILDQTGNIKLEGNVEYRFDIYKFLKGAAFIDMGNIWNLQSDTSQPLGNFDPKRFWGEIAVGAGLGLRLDFSYFIIRVDAAVPIHDPSYPKGERWTFDKINFSSREMRKQFLGINIGIGYPF
ncbi:MAG: BamA/TamA family outer membrane protein [Bacteroidetes bacterium]|nr:BamA/TamA family outer membrane protein [Bacteroidota bacterium]